MSEFLHGVLAFNIIFFSLVWIIALREKDVRLWMTIFLCLSVFFAFTFWNI